jgi:hypothetical protein
MSGGDEAGALGTGMWCGVISGGRLSTRYSANGLGAYQDYSLSSQGDKKKKYKIAALVLDCVVELVKVLVQLF